jgi:hypothetical protein
MLRHFRIFFGLIVLCFLLLPPRQAYSQQGFYLQPFFMYQYVTLANNKDHYSNSNASPRRHFQLVNTYKPAYGLRMIYNFSNAVGFETGIKYSEQGQKYKGDIIVDGNTGDTVNNGNPKDFTSELKLNYLQIPLMLSFNSILANINDEQDPLYMSIAVGIQLDYLQNASMTVNPGIDSFSLKYPNAESQFQNLFHSFNISFVGNLSLNWQMKHGWQINTTLFFSNTLEDVENKDFKFDKTQYPLEYQFPVSVKKEAVSTEVRYKAKNLVTGIMLGVSYRFYHN